VRVLGALALVDDGELDWKVLCINAEDPLASKLQDVNDIERECPGVVSGVREWFRWYKTPTGKPLNQFGFNGEPIGRSEALQVIEEAHAAWRRLVDGKTNKRSLWIPA
jgi:inorganic pyrophosphatase